MFFFLFTHGFTLWGCLIVTRMPLSVYLIRSVLPVLSYIPHTVDGFFLLTSEHSIQGDRSAQAAFPNFDLDVSPDARCIIADVIFS